MSKAFTKEDDNQDDDEPEEQGSALPSGKNYITPHGIARMRAELTKILDEERPIIVRTVTWAASNGDRSENGDYLYGKKKLRELDRRIRFLTKRLEIAEVVNPLEQKGNTVVFGATVTVEDESGQRRTYSIVGVDETDIAKGRVSWISPIGKALLQNDIGDVVTLRTPKGEEDLEIVDIKYVELL